MKVVSSVISIYSSDTAGVASSLYELGGMTVVHDASGCNSTYATHDEPRWYDGEGMVYISALTEKDAIMGNDDLFISNVAKAAEELNRCRFIAICGSPLPMMVGTDFDALAMEIENISSIPVIPLHTNGIRSYLAGADESWRAFAERFCIDGMKKDRRKVNILGATPLDFSVNGQIGSIVEFLESNGFEVNSCWSMGSGFDDLIKAGCAGVDLVISSAAVPLARYFEERFAIPYITALPFGDRWGRVVIESLKEAAAAGVSCKLCCESERNAGDVRIIGETLQASSLAAALKYERGIDCQVLNPMEDGFAVMTENDISVPDEDAVIAAFRGASVIIGDPLYKPVVPEDVKFIPLPHEAFSGRCFRKSIPDLIGKNFEKGLNIC